MSFFDDLETRSADQRANDLALALPAQIANAQKLSGYADALGALTPAQFKRLMIWLGCPFCANLIWCKPNRKMARLGDMVR